MKIFILSVLFVLTMFIAGYAESATTSDGVITLDFYEDTQSGIENRWILDFTVNDIDGPGGLEEIEFNLTFLNTAMDFNNLYNDFKFHSRRGWIGNPKSALISNE